MRPFALAAAGLAAAAGAARADNPVTRPEAIEVDTLAAPPGRAEFGFDGGGPIGAWAASLQLGYVDEPLVLRANGVPHYPVRHRETAALGGAIALGSTLVLDARLPFSHQVGERLVGLGDDRALDRWVLGDLGLGARVRITGTDTVQIFARFAATFGTGADHDFAGEAHYTYSTLLIGRAQLPAGIVVAATGGVLLRGAEVQVADRLVGDAIAGGLGVAVPVPPVLGLWCVPEQLRVTGEIVGELGDDVAHRRGPSPAEARLGVVGRPLPELAVAVHAGVGLDDQIGSPRFRALVELTWQAPERPVAPAAASSAAPDDDDDE